MCTEKGGFFCFFLLTTASSSTPAKRCWMALPRPAWLHAVSACFSSSFVFFLELFMTMTFSWDCLAGHANPINHRRSPSPSQLFLLLLRLSLSLYIYIYIYIYLHIHTYIQIILQERSDACATADNASPDLIVPANDSFRGETQVSLALSIKAQLVDSSLLAEYAAALDFGAFLDT